MLFSLVKVALTLIFVIETSSTDLEQAQSTLTQPGYYDCGSCFVHEILIQNMLYASGIDINEIATPFIELLYELDINYQKIKVPGRLTIPKSFRDMRPMSNPYVIIDQMLRIVDVVVQMKNGHYIRCKRVDEFTPEPTKIDPNDYGYECGHDLFSHDIVQRSAALARTNKIGNRHFLNHYKGPLYRPGLNYKIYPLSREKYQHYAGKIPEKIYYVVISPTGEMIDVIAELTAGDFIKCIRTTKVPPEIEADQDLRLGYSCGVEFFEINHVKRTVELARARRMHQIKQAYPKKYDDGSFIGLMYPLLSNGKFYGAGSVPGIMKHFIVMDLDFNIKFAAVKTKMGFTPCEASMRGIEVAPPETDNFKCGRNRAEFKNERLLKLVETACKALGSINRRYPALYNGPAFNVHGPYVTWPIRKGDRVAG
ncbi:hypothetical protein EPUL_004298, partial [Erysiphe pulchra]